MLSHVAMALCTCGGALYSIPAVMKLCLSLFDKWKPVMERFFAALLSEGAGSIVKR